VLPEKVELVTVSVPPLLMPPSLWAAAVSDGQVIDFQGAAWVRLEHPVIVVAVDGDARRYRRMVE